MSVEPLVAFYRRELYYLRESYCKVVLIHKDALNDWLDYNPNIIGFEIFYLENDLVQINFYI